MDVERNWYLSLKFGIFYCVSYSISIRTNDYGVHMFESITTLAYAMSIKYEGCLVDAQKWCDAINSNQHPTGGTLDDKMRQIGCDDKERLVKRLYNVFTKRLIINSEYEVARRLAHITKYNDEGQAHIDRTGAPMMRFSVEHGMPKPNINKYVSYLFMDEYEDCTVF
jgi:hypothetical protein